MCIHTETTLRGLTMQLIDAVAIVESSNNYAAIRFEASLYDRYPAWAASQERAIIDANHCDADTARAIACASWGKWQLLGCNIYSLGYGDAITLWAASPATQCALASAFIANCGGQPGGDIAAMTDAELGHFASRYNGPGAVASYVASLRRAAGVS